MYRSFFKNILIIVGAISIAACGGGGGGGGSDYGGGGGDYGSSNTAPVFTNGTTSYSAVENQTAAFTATASDADGDSLTFTISSGSDANIFSIGTSSGVVTFVAAPDFEIPGDANADNVYELTVRVSDGTAAATQAFTVTVTNDTSDDPVTSNYDGVLIRDGYIQSATVCIPVTESDGGETCVGATYTTTTATDGSFSLQVDDGVSGKLRAEDGFNAVTNDEDAFVMTIEDPVTNQNFVISPLSTLLDIDSRFSFESLKEKLGVDPNFMIRFDDPYLSVSDAASNKAALVNTQLLIMYESCSVLQELSGLTGDATCISTVNDGIYNRAANDETSLGDTTLVRDILLNIDLPNYTVTNTQLENLSGSLSSFLQKVYVDSNNEQAYFAMTARDYVTPLLKGILDDTVDSSEIDQIIFNTLDWITEKSSRTGLTDVENFRTTTYTVGNSGSAYYTVDGINADSTALVIYARVGDKIVFEPTANSVFSAHPFEISTTANDTNGSNNIGSPEGWDQSSHTLTVTDSTPTTLYPHCGVHTGMYTNGRIEIVTTYDQSLIDVESASGGLEVSGTVSVGPFKGASGNTHTVYLRAADAGSDYHEHQFHELPGLTFYMPADQGYHGATNSSGQTKFKTKSHY
tara:strand:+ start:135 stop:2033 length:1899 start_codon:yes stop_codon:yes gene_type:complete